MKHNYQQSTKPTQATVINIKFRHKKYRWKLHQHFDIWQNVTMALRKKYNCFSYIMHLFGPCKHSAIIGGKVENHLTTIILQVGKSDLETAKMYIHPKKRSQK